MSFFYGQRVKILSGKYVGLSGMVVDSTTASDELPLPQSGHYWIKILLHNQAVPVHVREDDIQPEFLEHDAIYIAPDGQRYRAELAARHYGKHRTCTLMAMRRAGPYRGTCSKACSSLTATASSDWISA